MPRTVMVTGASGFIGQHLIRRALATTDWDIVAVSRRATTSSDRVEAIQADLQRRWRLPAVDVVISLAASVDVARSIQQPRATAMGNAAIAAGLVDWAAEQQVPPLVIHVTTAEVYGPGGPHGLREPARPTNPYAASKAAQDAILHAAGASRGVLVVTARTANVFGEHQSPDKFVPTVVRRLLAGEQIRLFGDAFRRWIHADDVADTLIRLTGLPSDANVTGSTLVSNAQVVTMIGNRLAIRPSVDIVSIERPGQEVLYDLPPHGPITDDLEAGLDRAVAWWSR